MQQDSDMLVATAGLPAKPREVDRGTRLSILVLILKTLAYVYSAVHALMPGHNSPRALSCPSPAYFLLFVIVVVLLLLHVASLDVLPLPLGSVSLDLRL